jgi:hypothetical protein
VYIMYLAMLFHSRYRVMFGVFKDPRYKTVGEIRLLVRVIHVLVWVNNHILVNVGISYCIALIIVCKHFILYCSWYTFVMSMIVCDNRTFIQTFMPILPLLLSIRRLPHSYNKKKKGYHISPAVSFSKHSSAPPESASPPAQEPGQPQFHQHISGHPESSCVSSNPDSCPCFKGSRRVNGWVK